MARQRVCVVRLHEELAQREMAERMSAARAIGGPTLGGGDCVPPQSSIEEIQRAMHARASLHVACARAARVEEPPGGLPRPSEEIDPATRHPVLASQP